MARRAGRVARQREPADEEYFEDEDPDAVLADLQDEADFPDEEGGEDDGEYVLCPVCAGRNRACRYCEGFGDVHPDDIDPILAAVHADKQKRVVVGIGAFLFVGVLVAVFMVVYQSQQPDETNTDAAAGGTGTGATTTQPAAVKKNLPPLKRNKEVSAIIVEMRLDMKIKDYSAVIQKGTEAMGQTQDEVQRRNLQDMIDRAKRKLGQ